MRAREVSGAHPVASAAPWPLEKIKARVPVSVPVTEDSVSSTRNQHHFSIKMCADQLGVSISELHVHKAYRESLFLRRLCLISRCRMQQSPDICHPAVGRRRRTQTGQEVRQDGSHGENTTARGSGQNDSVSFQTMEQDERTKARQEDRQGQIRRDPALQIWRHLVVRVQIARRGCLLNSPSKERRDLWFLKLPNGIKRS